MKWSRYKGKRKNAEKGEESEAKRGKFTKISVVGPERSRRLAGKMQSHLSTKTSKRVSTTAGDNERELLRR